MTEWSCDYYTSLSDSSEPCWYSDDSEGNLGTIGLRRNLDLDSYKQFERTRPVQNNHELVTVAANGPDFDRAVLDDGAKLGPVQRKVAFQNAFDQSFKMSKSLPACNFYGNKPSDGRVSSMDVYELLCRSQAQEEKLAELQKKLFGQRQSDQFPNVSSKTKKLLSKCQGQTVDIGRTSCTSSMVPQSLEDTRDCKLKCLSVCRG